MRQAEVKRETRETQIEVSLNLDGQGTADVVTGIGFLDHMLVLLAKHGRLDLTVRARGDLETGDHHTAEDIGIVLGQAIGRALGEKRGICRYGQAMIPMDEAMAISVIDLSGRPYLAFAADFSGEQVGTFSTQMTGEFFRALAFNAGMTLHLTCPYGTNDHHMIEALFKAFARSFQAAAAPDPLNADQVPSSKGVL